MDIDRFSGENSDERHFCFVDGCFTTSARNKNLGFHQFPGNDKKRVLKLYKNGIEKLVSRRQLWIEALNIDKEATTVIGKMRVCSLHFSENDFIIADKKRPFSLLKNTAIPRRNLPLRRNSNLTTRLQVRNFNRLKWRGRLAFQDPDGRVPTSRRHPEFVSGKGNMKGFSSRKGTKSSKSGESVLKSSNSLQQLDGFSLAGTEAESIFDKDCNTSDDNGGIQCNSEGQITSELIIKEEPLSETEQEIENWEDDESSVVQDVNSLKEVQQPVDDQKGKEVEEKEKITTRSVLEDLLESSVEEEEEEEGDDGDDEDSGREKDEEEEEEEEGQVWRDRPCKVCGRRDCAGHPNAQSVDTMFACVICSQVFPTPTQLDAHSIIHEEEMNDDGGAGSEYSADELYRSQYKDLTCNICGKVLATKLTLKEHMLIHTGEKPHVYLLCGRAFRHKANLVVHINAHTIVREFECPMCPRMFSMRADLEDHKRTHTDQEYVCTICRDAFHSKRALWTHQKVHKRLQKKGRKGAKKGGLPCSLCNKVLSTKNTLKEHMMIHSGEKPHECMLCGKMIRHKANFIMHVQSHSAADSHRFQCEMCDRSFSRKTELRLHKQDEHAPKPYKCMLCGVAFRKEKGLMEHVEEAHGDNAKEADDDDYNGIFQPHLLAGFGPLR